MGRFSAPSPFSQGGTSNLYRLGFTYNPANHERYTMSWSGPVDAPRASSSALKRERRLSGQTNFMSPGRLKEIFRLLGITRHDFAQESGIRTGLIKDWLDGRRDIRPSVAQDLEAKIQTISDAP